MKIIAPEIRIITPEENKEIMGESYYWFDKDKSGIYEHDGKFYCYVGSTPYAMYFCEHPKDIKHGITISKPSIF
jgi:hypothetical protein